MTLVYKHISFLTFLFKIKFLRIKWSGFMSNCVTICCVYKTKARMYKLRENPEFAGVVLSKNI